MSLKLSNPEAYLELLASKIPKCLKCQKLFQLGFPNTEEGLQDYLICFKNDLLCNCDNYKKLSNLIKSKGEALLDIESYYR